MATGSSTTAVTTNAEVLFSTSSAASPTTSSTPTSKESAPVPFTSASPDSSGSDAVKVLLSKVADSAEAGSKENKNESVDVEKMENELAERLRSSLNQNTAIKFNVDFHGKGKGPGYISSFNFQIVDRETGRVVRQFPPNEMVKIRQVNAGLFVDDSA